uniref:Uncharacterized protein n=1 Tax=Rhizophora mucronata TaxID=61149 RepID=A0A2P2NWY2_RHIMU
MLVPRTRYPKMLHKSIDFTCDDVSLVQHVESAFNPSIHNFLSMTFSDDQTNL